MTEFLKVNGQEYPAESMYRYKDRDWDNRETKSIRLTMSAADAAALLPTGTHWSIVQREAMPEYDEDGQPAGETQEIVNEWDNSDYSLSGAITDHRDGTVSIKMGKPTEVEMLRAQLAELEEAYSVQ